MKIENIRSADLEKINKMLLEMASGNFFYRLDRGNEQDSLASMSLVLNMLAEEIQESLIHEGYATSKGVVKHIIQLCFVLDRNGIVKSVNQNACSILSFLHRDLLEKNFDSFLDGPSVKRWAKTLKKLHRNDFYDTTLELCFMSKEGLLLPNTCHISTAAADAKGEKHIWVTVVLYSKDLKERKRSEKLNRVSHKNGEPQVSKNRPKLSFEDIRKIREGQNLILNNLESDLPSLKEFAHQLGTNEFKLKYGFKQLYGTTVYRFLLKERLRKAKMLIQHTDFTIKTIAYQTGFKSIPHFSRVFKKKYGHPPSELRKISGESSE